MKFLLLLLSGFSFLSSGFLHGENQNTLENRSSLKKQKKEKAKTKSLSKSQRIQVTFPLKTEERSWKKNFHEEDQFISLTEYCLEGETEENWTELLTVQAFSAKCDVVLRDFFENAIKELSKNLPRNQIKSHIVTVTNDMLIGDWWIKDKSPNDQHEWVKIVKKEAEVAILRYTSKRIKQEAMSAKIWEHLSNESTFK